MEPTIKIIDGFNKEKELLTGKLCELEGFGYTAIKERAAVLIKRITEIDSILEQIRKDISVK